MMINIEDPIVHRHRSSKLADELVVEVDDNNEYGPYAAILEYNLKVEMIDKLGWAEHTSDWDLGTIVTLRDGRVIHSAQGDPTIEWARTFKEIDLLQDIQKLVNHVLITVMHEKGQREEWSSRVRRDEGSLSVDDDNPYEYVDLIVPIDQIQKMELYY